LGQSKGEAAGSVFESFVHAVGRDRHRRGHTQRDQSNDHDELDEIAAIIIRRNAPPEVENASVNRWPGHQCPHRVRARSIPE
jgi:hypothetical protein